MINNVILQNWEESERGFGTRPDGFTLHLTVEDHALFVKEYWAAEKKRNPSGITPDEYTRTDGEARTVTVGPKTFRQLLKMKASHGCWNYGLPDPAPKHNYVGLKFDFVFP